MQVGGSASMFSSIEPGISGSQSRWRVVSLALHYLLLAWLVHAPAPQRLMPNSVAIGRNGTSLTRLYWPTETPDDSKASSSDRATETYRRQRLAHQKLTWKRTPRPTQRTAPAAPLSPSEAEDKAETQTLSKLGHGAPAGLPYGTLSRGPVFGDEIRPALPLATVDPVVNPWELPAGSDGNSVVEITIDERGEIVQKVVLQSLGPEIDAKVLSALENWHFHPATKNGVAIASKQDVVYHFKPTT